METKDLDIVYCVKESPTNEELRYSLRSLENIPHRKVWIYGGCPNWVNTEQLNHIPIVQGKINKWMNTSALLRAICRNENITQDFIWFNDDFFVLKPIESLGYYKDRTLIERIYDFAKMGWWQLNGPYQRRLKEASRALTDKKHKTDNYELHIPYIFNRKKLATLYKIYPGIGAKRSLYGNTYEVDGQQMADVKIYDWKNLPQDDWEFLSTTDESFAKGQVGDFIRKQFNKQCRFEKEDEWITDKVK